MQPMIIQRTDSHPRMPHQLTLLYWLCAGAVMLAGSLLAADEPQLRVVPGLTIRQFSGPELATNIYTLALDPHGHPTVSGPGYIAILVDRDGDGRADLAELFASAPREGAQGLYWDGTDLYVTGDGAVLRYQDRDGDHRPDDEPAVLLRIKTGSEHDAHAIRRGPDGYFYLVCGNMTGISSDVVTDPASPVREPIAGTVLRISPDWSRVSVYAHGFRNAYDFAFNSDGELFTYDSDNERCQALPWYEPTRLYHVLPGGFYGWLSPQRAAWWRYPPWFPDVVPPLLYLGRGSPTGVEAATVLRLPGIGRRDLIVADWTFGRIIHVSLEPGSVTYRARSRVLVQATGGAGFAPTDLAADPTDGSLWICIGGRGTRGAVYRLSAAARATGHEPRTRQPEALAPHDVALYRRLATAVPGTAARADLDRALRKGDRLLLGAALRHAAQVAHDSGLKRLVAGQIVALFATARSRPDETLDAAQRLLASDLLPWQQLWVLRAAQLASGGVGGGRYRGHVWSGYSPSEPRTVPPGAGRLVHRIATLVTSRHRAVRWEAARWLAIVGGGNAPQQAARQLVRAAANAADALELEHMLIAFSRLPATARASHTDSVARLLVALPYRLDKAKVARDRNWPYRIRELYEALARGVPSLHEALLRDDRFGHASHTAYLLAPNFPTRAGIQRCYELWRQGRFSAWNEPLVRLARELEPTQRRVLIERLWADAPELRPELLLLVATAPRTEDRPRLIEGLTGYRADVAAACLDALRMLGGAEREGEAVLLAARWWQRLAREKKPAEAAPFAAYVRAALGQDLTRPEEALAIVRRRWPTDAALDRTEGDWLSWANRLERVRWREGNAERGRMLFKKLGCIHCHNGTSFVGPDLRGVTRRFSRLDLFRAIVLPDEIVPERYRATRFLLADGRVVEGIVVYESARVVLVHTADGLDVRLDPLQVERRVQTGGSIMPRGLLRGLSDREIADLYAYLRSL